MKDCKIIRDLLPSYIDGLTDEVTNQFIEEHLNNCEQCKKILEDMQKIIGGDVTLKDSKEVKYIKKFNKKMKILKIILLAILLMFVLSYARKMRIVVSLNNKISEYTSSTNYYIKSVSYEKDGLAIIENYKKEEKYIRRVKTFSEFSKSITTDFYNGETINTYSEFEIDEGNGYRKTVKINSLDNPLVPAIPNSIDIKHTIAFWGIPLFSTITSEQCNGIDCYRIVIYSLGDKSGAIYYIDKETGLTIRVIGESTTFNADGTQYDIITDFQYEFDVVTDEDFIEPDKGEYEIEE